MRSLYPVSPLHTRDSGVSYHEEKKIERTRDKRKGKKIIPILAIFWGGGGWVDLLKIEPKGVYSRLWRVSWQSLLSSASWNWFWLHTQFIFSKNFQKVCSLHKVHQQKCSLGESLDQKRQNGRKKKSLLCYVVYPVFLKFNSLPMWENWEIHKDSCFLWLALKNQNCTGLPTPTRQWSKAMLELLNWTDCMLPTPQPLGCLPSPATVATPGLDNIGWSEKMKAVPSAKVSLRHLETAKDHLN